MRSYSGCRAPIPTGGRRFAYIARCGALPHAPDNVINVILAGRAADQLSGHLHLHFKHIPVFIRADMDTARGTAQDQPTLCAVEPEIGVLTVQQGVDKDVETR